MTFRKSVEINPYELAKLVSPSSLLETKMKSRSVSHSFSVPIHLDGCIGLTVSTNAMLYYRCYALSMEHALHPSMLAYPLKIHSRFYIGNSLSWLLTHQPLSALRHVIMW